MPGSVVEGKELVKDFCIRNGIHTVLDIGPGEGTYYFALQGADITKLDGVEVFVPYIEAYGLNEKYDEIFISDIYYLNWDKLQRHDLVILGDVIEHMTKEQGREVIANAAKYADYVAVSLPIYGYAQGPACGNVFETHVEQYSDASIREVLKDYEILESFIGQVVGVYIFKEKS